MRLVTRTLGEPESPITAAEALAVTSPLTTAGLLDMSQGVPNYPPAPVVVEGMADTVRRRDGNSYTPRVGLEDLRRAFAKELCETYDGHVRPEQILISAGCSQAFCLVAAALTEVGDEMAMPMPYYFDHARWLHLDRAVPIFFACDEQFIPAVSSAQSVLSPRTRGIVVTTPGNPTGVTIPPETIGEFADLAKREDLVLILDETYRSFASVTGPPHRLFARTDWPEYVVSLHSFSKDLAIPGCRVGAIVGDTALINEVLKIHSCTTICAPRVGQEAAITGLTHARQWRMDRVAEMHEKRRTFETVMASNPGGFELAAAGAFFGWVRHPYRNESSESVVRRLLTDCKVHALPGTAFMPNDEGFLRFSFANLTVFEIVELEERFGGMK